MNHQYPSMRYHGGYVGMEQPFPPGQMHPQHMPPQPPPQEAQQVSPGHEEQQQPQQQTAEPVPLGIQQQMDPQGQMGHHAGVPHPYSTNVAHFPYNNQMQIQRGPGGPQMGGYHPQIIGGPQQMPVAPGNPYRPMYSVPQHPPSMRGPNGGNYYANMPPQYSHYMTAEGDDYRGGGRGGGRMAGRGRRGGRSKGGRMGNGRGYSNWISGQGVGQPNGAGGNGGGGGRYTPQNIPSEDPTPAEMLAISEQKALAE
jgi:translation initiation factor IF-2